MTALERAQTYAAIFIHAEDNWRSYVPVDATVAGDTVYMQGVRMERAEDGWRLTENDESWTVLAKAGA